MSNSKQVFNLLNYPTSKSTSARLAAFLLIFASLISGITGILQTEPIINQYFSLIFIIISIITGLIFVLEYILRLWSCNANPDHEEGKFLRLKYMKSVVGIIDLISAISFIFTLVAIFNIEFMILALFFRLVALLKLIRYIDSFKIIWAVLKRKKEELLITIILSLLLLFFGSILIYIAEHEAQPDKITNLFSSMYFTSINLFTIGYGDIVPITPFGKIVSGVISIIAIMLFFLPAAVLGSGFIEEIEERRPHYDVCTKCNAKHKRDEFLNEAPEDEIKEEKADKPNNSKSIKTPRKKLYHLMQFKFPKEFGQLVVFFFFMTIITLNVLAILVETNPVLSQRLRPILIYAYFFSIIIFIAEYIIRLWSCVESEREEYHDRLNYIKSPGAIVDFIVIIALILMLISLVYFPHARQFFLIPLFFVVFKIGHYLDVFSILKLLFKDCLKEILSVLILCIIFLLFSSSIIYYVERNAQPNKFSSIPATLWYGIITFTTTGFGDMVAVTTTGRFATVCLAFLGVALFTMPAGILGSSFFCRMEEYRMYKICPECGFVLSKQIIHKREK